MALIGDKEFFKGVGKINYEGPDSDNPLAFKYYNHDLMDSTGSTTSKEPKTGAGKDAQFSDSDYESAGATIVTKEEAWAQDLVVKVFLAALVRARKSRVH